MPTGFSVAVAGADDAAIVSRVVEAYHRAVADQPPDVGGKADMWSDMAAGPHREIADLLARGDVAGVGQYLAEAHAKDLTVGVTQGENVTGLLRARSDVRARVIAPFVDCLTSLEESLGVPDVECSDQAGAWGDLLYADPQRLVDRIATTVGAPVVLPPVIGSAFGIATRDGVVSGRDVLALFAALRLRQVAAEYDLPAPHRCEIGGGLGAVAYHSVRLHVGRHTIVDLTTVGLLPGYFLVRALPDARVRLYGEPAYPPADVSLLPPHCFEHELTVYDVLFNQDSMPEMHRAVSLAYLRRAPTNVRYLFVSVNQEARAAAASGARQTVVRELVHEAGGFRPVSRNRQWPRAGYVEMVYHAVGPE